MWEIERMSEEDGKANEAPEIAAALDARTDDPGDDAFERWLRDEAAATYDKMKGDPSRALSAKQVFGGKFGGNC